MDGSLDSALGLGWEVWLSLSVLACLTLFFKFSRFWSVRNLDLLLLFASHPGRAFSRDFLLERLWSDDYEGFDRVVDTHIARLRKKLGLLGESIVAVRGVGYRFEPGA